MESKLSFDEFVDYLKGLNNSHGRLYCLNILTATQDMLLPDAILFYDCFVNLD